MLNRSKIAQRKEMSLEISIVKGCFDPLYSSLLQLLVKDRHLHYLSTTLNDTVTFVGFGVKNHGGCR